MGTDLATGDLLRGRRARVGARFGESFAITATTEADAVPPPVTMAARRQPAWPLSVCRKSRTAASNLTGSSR